MLQTDFLAYSSFVILTSLLISVFLIINFFIFLLNQFHFYCETVAFEMWE